MAAAAAVITAGFGLVGASPASANQVWLQQVQRTSADAPCALPASDGEATGWSSWAPSWAQWPNNGEGGWVCERSITWATDSGSASMVTTECAQLTDTQWLDFTGTDWLPADTATFPDAACTTAGGGFIFVVFVLADSQGAAQSLCDAHGGGTATHTYPIDPRIYYCLL